MTEKSQVFERIIADYLAQVAATKERQQVASRLGIRTWAEGFEIPFFNRVYTITSEAITNDHGTPAGHAVAVILCKYILLCPENPSNSEVLVTYKDFRDAAPFVGGFFNTAEDPIARSFRGKADRLESQCRRLGGCVFETEVACQLAYRLQALPQIPVFLLFNDADEEFPASCTLLFQKSAADYLDMECIAMTGSTLAARLQTL
jgi:hypothetical protein